MFASSCRAIYRGGVWFFLVFGCGALVVADDSSRARALFADPPREYASAPLWTWNDMLTEDQVRSTLRDLAAQKVMQVFVHPRPGLMTPYLSDDWFRLWKAALDEAEKADMNVWIYDENSYPSGFAGGLVPEAMPKSRGKGVHVQEVKQPTKPGDDVLAIFRVHDGDYENVTDKARTGGAMPEGRYLVATIRLAPPGGWFGGKWYVDLIQPGVTEKFIEITMEAYRRHFGDQFGKRLPGWFTDEPHLAPAGGLHWSDHLPELFQKRWGYDLVDHLPCLVEPVGDWKRVRHNYYCLLLEQFIEHWSKPCYAYCEQHDLEFTGHYWEHGWPGAGHGGDNMAMYAWHQRPAIDCLMNQYKEDVHAQFGNIRANLELQSVANQLGRKRTLCEAYGAGGWDLRFEDMKRIGDWLYVMGINTLDEHLSYVTIRGARKRDHPQSFSYHEPWWEAYHVMAEHFTRLSLALSEGQQVYHVLLLEPTTTAWMYQGDPHLNEIGNTFQTLVNTLAKEQVEFDLGCEDIMGRHGAVDGADLVIGERRYHTVVLPPHTENLNTKTMALIEAYTAAGGIVLACGPAPRYVDGNPSQRGAALADRPGWRQIDPAQASSLMAARAADGFVIKQRTSALLFHHRRQLDDGELLFLVNTSIDHTAAGTIESPARGVEQWWTGTGKITGYPFATTGAGVQFRYELPPCASLLLFLSQEPREPAPAPVAATERVPPAGPLAIDRLEPNVLTLDYVDVTAGGETKTDLYFFKAAQFVFQKNGLGSNPWEGAVQLRDQLITKEFPPESGFEATYRFTIEGDVPKPLSIVIERPDLYTITCNGMPVAAAEGAWWLDKSFGRIDITAAAQSGTNAVTLQASPFTIWHELEPAYVLGSFSLKPVERGFVIVPERPLGIVRRLAHDNSVEGSALFGREANLSVDGSGIRSTGLGWNRQGAPFYASGVGYRQKFHLPKPSGQYVVALGPWLGSVAKVLVNDAPAGYITHRPWECNVTAHLKPGENTIEVVVIGTLKNTLGPHHAGSLRGAAWPHMFQRGPEHGPPPGSSYDTIGYGLFEPFVLKRGV